MIPAAPLTLAADRWRSFAEHEGLAFRGTPLTMVGEHVAARTRRIAKRDFRADVTLRLPEPLESGVAIGPAKRLEVLWGIFAASDVQVGDAAFDRAFTIAARDPTLAATLLDAEVRDRIMTLRKLGDVHLGDQGIALQTSHPEEVPSALELMRGVLEGVRDNARDAARRGPYR